MGTNFKKMKSKKNPKRDLNKNSALYFVIGLAMVLFLTFIAFEWKTYDKTNYDDIGLNTLDKDLTEELPPIIVPKTPPPPQPPVAPDLIEVIKDEAPIEETFIKTSESNEEIQVIDVNDIPDLDVEPEINVDWVSIEEVPVFPGCEDDKDKRACFQKMMNKHIIKVFRYPEIAQEMGIEGKVYTHFTIQKDGSIGGILLRGPDKLLEKEAERIINKLPKMKPGKQRDRNVKVAFTIPINFRLQ